MNFCFFFRGMGAIPDCLGRLNYIREFVCHCGHRKVKWIVNNSPFTAQPADCLQFENKVKRTCHASTLQMIWNGVVMLNEYGDCPIACHSLVVNGKLWLVRCESWFCIRWTVQMLYLSSVGTTWSCIIKNDALLNLFISSGTKTLTSVKLGITHEWTAYIIHLRI